jgi:hypothetical protein
MPYLLSRRKEAGMIVYFKPQISMDSTRIVLSCVTESLDRRSDEE